MILPFCVAKSPITAELQVGRDLLACIIFAEAQQAYPCGSQKCVLMFY
jgi:hypothetical protein